MASMLLSSRRVSATATLGLAPATRTAIRTALATALAALLAAGFAAPGMKMPTIGPATEASLPAVELVPITPAVLAASRAACSIKSMGSCQGAVACLG